MHCDCEMCRYYRRREETRHAWLVAVGVALAIAALVLGGCR